MKNKRTNCYFDTIGTYTYPHFANKGKVIKILDTLKEYRKTAQEIAKIQWGYFFMNQQFNKYLPLKNIDSKLSERYKQTCQWQVYGVLEGYISKLQNKFVNIVLQSNLPREDKLILLALNFKKAWLKYEDSKITCYNNRNKISYIVTDKHKLIAKKIFHYLLKTNKMPDLKNISMHLDEKVAVVMEKVSNKTKTFDYWIRLSALEKRNPIYIPLKKNSYAESLEGEYLKFIQIVEKDGSIQIKRVKSLKVRQYISETESIAIDLGLNPLFATDRGDLLGRNFLKTLTEFDRKITNRMRFLQKNNIRPRSDKKYCKLIENLRSYLKNEINRILNRIVETYKPATIIIEKLNFQSPELSKKMNRLIQNFGKKYIREKLNRFKELFSIKIIEVNPAYTSQECSSCGYIDSGNRKDTETFRCKACNSKINAQVNGARNISKRSSLAEVSLHTPKKRVLQILVNHYLERLNGCNSAPIRLFKENPYFKGCLNSLKTLECKVNKCL